MKSLKPAVFLDRDGTIIEDVHYLKDKKDLKLIQGTAEALKRLKKMNFLTFLVTNQSGVARGYFDEDNVSIINNELNSLLEKENASLDSIYYCPHHPKGAIEEYAKQCNCRKPATGMIDSAIKDFENIDIKNSYVIGDKFIDVELAHNAGCKGILVKTGHGLNEIEKNKDKAADYIANDITDAVNWIEKDINS